MGMRRRKGIREKEKGKKERVSDARKGYGIGGLGFFLCLSS